MEGESVVRVLVSAGPTVEAIDDVRFISNRSSGRMGFAVADEALSRGFGVTVVCGPTQARPPADARVVRVDSAAEMREALLRELSEGEYDVFVSAAAVADYTLDKRAGKIRSGSELTLKLKPTKKIVDEVKKKFPGTFVVAFKAEHGVSGSELVERARNKISEGNLDLVVANDVSGGVFGGDENEVAIVGKDGLIRETGRKSKREIAGDVWGVILTLLSSSRD